MNLPQKPTFDPSRGNTRGNRWFPSQARTKTVLKGCDFRNYAINSPSVNPRVIGTVMGQVVPFDDPGNYSVVMRRILRLLDEGEFFIPAYARDRMMQRNWDELDVIQVLRRGRVRNGSHSKPTPQSGWRWIIDGKDVEGKRATCVVEIRGGLIIVTVYPKTGRR